MMNLLIRVALARNNMRTMLKGDLAFFYHSNCKIPGIAGIMEIVQEHSLDGKETFINLSVTADFNIFAVQVSPNRFLLPYNSLSIYIVQILTQSQNPRSIRLILTTTQSRR